MTLKPGQRYFVKLSDGMLVITPSTDPSYPGVWIDFTREDWAIDQTVALIEETNRRDYIDVRVWRDSYDDPCPVHISKEKEE